MRKWNSGRHATSTSHVQVGTALSKSRTKIGFVVKNHFGVGNRENGSGFRGERNCYLFFFFIRSKALSLNPHELNTQYRNVILWREFTRVRLTIRARCRSQTLVVLDGPCIIQKPRINIDRDKSYLTVIIKNDCSAKTRSVFHQIAHTLRWNLN